jgi:carbon starvation protein
MLKIFSTVPAVGYFAQNKAFSDALAAGKTKFGTAPSVAAMEAVVRNTMVQGLLSILFVTLAIIVIAAAIVATWKSWKTRDFGTNEDPALPAQMFAPSGLVPTPAEKELQGKWETQIALEKAARVGGSGTPSH